MINIAIIGTGNISHSHIKAYLEFPERCRITGLVDIYPEKAEQIKQKYNLTEAEVFDSHKKLYSGETGVDLVSICTPPFCHAEITVDCLNAGIHTIVEKPMASSLEECDLMIAAAEKSGKVFSVIAQNRFRDPIWGLKQVLDSGKAGRILHG
jgi:predicted dehydrogenase